MKKILLILTLISLTTHAMDNDNEAAAGTDEVVINVNGNELPVPEIERESFFQKIDKRLKNYFKPIGKCLKKYSLSTGNCFCKYAAKCWEPCHDDLIECSKPNCECTNLHSPCANCMKCCVVCTLPGVAVGGLVYMVLCAEMLC